jgi:hypothetical protein
MAENEQKPAGPNARVGVWWWIARIALAVIVVVMVVESVFVSRAEPILRARVVETLSTRFKSKVELDAFHV